MNRLLFFLLLISSSVVAQPNTKAELEAIFKDKTEVYFKFMVSSKMVVNELSKIISIDHKSNNNVVYAYANQSEFSSFLSYEIPYVLLKSAGELAQTPVMLKVAKKKSQNNWDYYPTYDAYDSIMFQFETDYPSLCKIHTMQTLASGRDLLIAHIGDGLGIPENEPRVLYTSSMHGDELTGYVLTLRLIDHLLTNYGTNSRVTHMVDNIDIWINPLANPDGAYTNNNNTISGATRYNANFVDLNRNYPDPQDGPHPDGNSYQDETQAFMAMADTLLFNISSNLHGGAEVANYPWDTWSPLHADDSWWQYVCGQYADTAHANSPSGYLTGFNNGITNGNDWYEIDGGRQDYTTYFKYGREFTLELSNNKIPNANKLPDLWDYNYRSLLNYLEQSLYGLRGIVTDSITGDPLRALVFIDGHDKDSSHIYSTLPVGNFHRYLASGTYSVSFSSPGYYSKTINGIGIQYGAATVQDVELAPYGSTGPTGPTGSTGPIGSTGSTGSTGPIGPTVPASIYTPGIDLTLSPQPADEWVDIGFINSPAIDLIRVYDITGRQYKLSHIVNGKTIRLHTTNLISGVYFIKLEGDGFLYCGKLLVK